MIQYGTECIDENNEIVNPPYRKISYKIKSLSAKIQRREARFYTIVEQINQELVDEVPSLTTKQIKMTEAITILKNEKEKLLEQRKEIPNRIKLKEMPDATRYTKPKPESKLFLNIIKMICYHAKHPWQK